MKKILPILSLILFATAFSSCSDDVDNNEDAALQAQILGKWKLTAAYSDDQLAPTPISNGYLIEFKANKTFVSNEVNGYSKGSYTLLKKPGNNLRLVYQKQWDAKVAYKYIDEISNGQIYLQASSPEPTPEGHIFLSGYVLTRVP